MFHIPHPQLLGCNAWGPAAAFVDRLGLTASDDIPKDLFEADQASADGGVAFPAGRSELVGLVQAHLSAASTVTPTSMRTATSSSCPSTVRSGSGR